MGNVSKAVAVTIAVLTGAAGPIAATAAAPTPGRMPTDPATLVNDPLRDLTGFTTQAASVATVSGGNVVVAYGEEVDPTGSSAGWSVSTDGGTSFRDRGALPGTTAGTKVDPSLATDAATGRVYLAAPGLPRPPIVQVFRSDDAGIHFGMPANAAPEGHGTAVFPSVAVDNAPGPCQGNVYLGWRQVDRRFENGMHFTRSLDGGDTWGPSAHFVSASLGTGATVVVGADHVVHYFWATSTAVVTIRSTDCGASFGPATSITPLSGSGLGSRQGLKLPRAAVDPVTGAIFVAFHDEGLWGEATNAYYVSSTDGGATWSPRARIDGGSAANDQFQPVIAMTPNGKGVMVSWFDRRRDPADVEVQRYGRIGRPRGGVLHLGRNFVLSPGFPALATAFDAIAATDDAFVATWTDTRDHAAYRQAAPYELHQPDIRFATLPTRGTSHVSLGLAGPAAAVHGDDVLITATVTSEGPTAASMAVVELDVPSTLVAAADDAVGGSCSGTTRLTCRVGTVAPHRTATLTVPAFAVASGDGTVTGSLTTATADPEPADDSAVLGVAVGAGQSATVAAGTGDVSVRLPRLASLDIPIEVEGAGRVLDVDASFRAGTSYTPAMVVQLVSPAGTPVALVHKRGRSYPSEDFGSGAESCAGTPTAFDDSAATPIAVGAPPFAGTYRPEEPLSRFAGEAVAGTWTLRVTSFYLYDYHGELFCAELDILTSG